jgi:hypothetical protein
MISLLSCVISCLIYSVVLKCLKINLFLIFFGSDFIALTNKSEQGLQIIEIAKFYANNNRSMHGRRQLVISNATL